MAATKILGVPDNLNPHHPAPVRVGSIDSLSNPLQELDKNYLTVEQTSFANGSVSDVFAGSWAPPQHPNGIEVAVKVLRIPGDVNSAETAARLGKRVAREVLVWKMVQHPRITPFIGYIREYKDGIVPCIVTKRRRQGNLAIYLSSNPQADRFQLLCQVLEGVIYLHTFPGKPVIHFDIKPGNILITDDGEAEVCDFGHAKAFGGESTGYTTSPNPGGTFPYMSPEVLNGEDWEDLTPAVDIFAMGSTILYALSGKVAWYYIKSKAGLIGMISNGRPAARDRYVIDGSIEAVTRLWELLERCWSLEPSDRPSSQEVLDELKAIEAIGGARQPAQQSTAAGQVDAVHDSTPEPEDQLELPQPLDGILTPIEFVGWGGYSEIRRGVLTQGSKDILVGIKYLKPRSPRGGGQLPRERFETRFRRETVIWRRAQHENILPFIGYQIEQEMPILVSVWCANGNLERYIEEHPELTECDKLKLLCDAARGLEHLHTLKPPVVHGDIKPDNVLITSQLRAVLADFGVSRLMVDLGVHTGLTTAGGAGGPAGYQAIELMQATNVEPTDKSDIYSFGGLILATMTGKPPFWQIRTDAVIVITIVKGIIPKPEDHQELPPTNTLWGLMKRCWNPYPVQRPCMKEITGDLEEETRHLGSILSGSTPPSFPDSK